MCWSRFRILIVCIVFSAGLALSCGQRPAVGDASLAVTTDSVEIEPDSLFKLGLRAQTSGHKDSALSYYHAASRVLEKRGDSIQLVDIYKKIGDWYRQEYKFVEADSYYEKARLLAIQKEMAVDIILPVNIFSAGCKIELKDFATANSLLHETVTILGKPGHRNDTLLAACYDRLSELNYVDGRYQEAVAFLLKEIDLAKRLQPGDIGRLYSNASLIYIAQNDYARALEFINYSIESAEKSGPNRLAISYRNKGDILVRMGLLDSARICYTRNLEIRRENYGEKHANTFGAYQSMGTLFQKKGMYDSAVAYFQKSLVALVRDFNDLHWKSNPEPATSEIGLDLVLGLTYKAEALEQLYQSLESDAGILVGSLKTYMLADSVFNVYRKNLAFDDNKLNQLETNPISYEKVIGIAFRLHDLTANDEFLGHALLAMESSRSKVLQDALLRAEAFSQIGLPASLRQEESELLRGRRRTLLALGKDGNTPRTIDSLNAALLENHDKQRSLEMNLQLSNRNYYSIKYGPHSDLRSLMKWLSGTRSLFISYQVSTDKIFAVAVGSSSVKKNVIPITDDLMESLNFITSDLNGGTRERYKKAHHEAFCRSAFHLYKALIRDCVDGVSEPIENLIISPDRMLSSFPFEALITNAVAPAVVDYHLPYLIKRYSITYVHSAGLMELQSSFPRHGDRLLAFGHGRSQDDGKNLQDLPGTIDELNSIEGLMNNSDNRFYLAAEASESKFKSQVKGYNILHLAIHGSSDTLNALRSSLFFNTTADSVEDGRLYAHELYGLELDNLELAVLSACESGVGKRQRGEGVMSIARGFAYAGCPSMVMSLWKIDDRTSATLMEGFYRHLADGFAVNKALANSKVEYLQNANQLESHPFYWAGFIQMGDPREIISPRAGWFLWLVAFLTLLTLVYYTRQRVYSAKSQLPRPRDPHLFPGTGDY